MNKEQPDLCEIDEKYIFVSLWDKDVDGTINHKIQAILRCNLDRMTVMRIKGKESIIYYKRDSGISYGPFHSLDVEIKEINGVQKFVPIEKDLKWTSL